tara:strand:- start:49641 stop:50021 length:381 start_codon:yes stop_codon:yes gene_type:complete
MLIDWNCCSGVFAPELYSGFELMLIGEGPDGACEPIVNVAGALGYQKVFYTLYGRSEGVGADALHDFEGDIGYSEAVDVSRRLAESYGIAFNEFAVQFEPYGSPAELVPAWVLAIKTNSFYTSRVD